MPRPKKCRRIGFVPKHTKFGPVDGSETSEPIILHLDEAEAIRLKDIEKLDQAEAAIEMGVSRQTFQNILEAAREKVAKSLLIGADLDIQGGHIIYKTCTAVCSECGSEYDMSKGEWNGVCKNCGSTNLYCPKKDRKCCH